jgi:hypothetical protein
MEYMITGLYGTEEQTAERRLSRVGQYPCTRSLTLGGGIAASSKLSSSTCNHVSSNTTSLELRPSFLSRDTELTHKDGYGIGRLSIIRCG